MKETNLRFKPLSYVEPFLTWQVSAHSRADAFWEKRAASNPGSPLSHFTHVQYSLIEKKNQWFVTVTHVTCKSVSLQM